MSSRNPKPRTLPNAERRHKMTMLSLDDETRELLTLYADERHEGNKSRAVRELIRNESKRRVR